MENKEGGSIDWSSAYSYKDGKLFSLRFNRFVGHKTVEGYLRIYHKGRYYYAHRVIWELVNGPIPAGMLVDHTDRDKSNNLIENLRLATQSQNQANTKRHCNNSSGYRGVSFDKKGAKWVAQIKHNRNSIKLGRFDSAEEASSAYNLAAAKLKSEFFNRKD